MILSNVEIVNCIEKGLFSIDPLEGKDPTKSPYNTSAIDLRLAEEILVPKKGSPIQLDIQKGNIAKFWEDNSDKLIISESQPFSLPMNKFVMGRTRESVDFPLHDEEVCYSARVEGRSSLARCGILVHFTAPTIHAGFKGTITLEIINFGIFEFLLKPNLHICQLIIEEVKGRPNGAPNQFSGQATTAGVV